jgi:hypothetical protein
MTDTLVNLVVIVIIVGTVLLALYTYFSSRKNQSSSDAAEKAFSKWISTQSFTPSHASCFGGTGIAMKDGDNRLVLQSRGKVNFYSFNDVTAIKTFQTTASSRPLGAAPGVVEVTKFQLFNIDITIKNIANPVRILVKNEEEMQQWELRLRAAANI